VRPVSSRGVRSHTRNGRTVRGYRQGYQSRAQQAALRWRKLKRAFRPTRRHTGKHPARRRHDNEPWRSRPVLGGPRSRDGIYKRSGNGEWRKVA